MSLKDEMNKYGDMVYHKCTDEPSTVLKEFKHFTLVRRPIMGENGIRYRLGIFFNVELESLTEQTQRTLSTIKARQEVAQAEVDFAPEMAMPALQFKKSTN